ncbi:putative g1 s-specific cyclin pas1 [Diplodia seriata]|uniref:Putative g1 s-specific cyclin pas1 n=1 Tax=Diplodia seriata TaxID=420778 RepID=A0A0G2H185_9PEZI|nr:putative g1 s-specific cyclin pas1 [Diplodia seriata]
MVEVIWPLSVPTCPNERVSGRGVLPLRTFIQETLRRSRTSYSTLQVALYYLILIKAHVPKLDFTMEQPEDQSVRALQCGRRMFLAALILASKYLQDRNYSARAWSKISGLKVSEINTNEMAFLKAVNWKLHITDPVFERWQAVVLRAAPSSQPPPSPGAFQMHLGMHDWKTLIPMLTPELDTFDIVRRNSVQICIPKRLTPPPPPVAITPVRESWLLESTPVSRPKASAFCLEPMVDMTPPAPMMSRLGPLPTPQMTPQSTVSNTPAQKEKESSEVIPAIVPSESLSSPDLESFHINDASEATPVPFQQNENVSPNTRSDEVAKGRKRCRSSVDMSLQQNVRDLVNPEKLAAETLLTLDPSVLQRTPGIVADRSLASSFLLHTPGRQTPSSTFDFKALQSPFAVVPEVRRPVQRDLGRKRACCASEVAQVLQARAGPGMWEGVI